MILTDTGPLVALFDRGERQHQACVSCLSQLRGPMLTTWPVFTEAMYLLGDAAGWLGQAALWKLVARENLVLAQLSVDDQSRMQLLMEKYRDRPMDLADASLVALAEREGLRDIFTLDVADFSTYRIKGRTAFRLWPS